MSNDIFGLLALALVAAIGYVMVRSFNSRRGNTGSSHDSSAGYWSSGSDISGPSAVSSRNSESSGWFGGLFGSSDSSSGSSDSSGGDSGGGGGGGGD